MLGADERPLFTFRGPWGVPVDVAPSFLLLALIFVALGASVHAFVFFGMVALAIYLHELGHVWGALVQGHAVRRVVLFGGGGFCEYARHGTPQERELMTAMGPLTNLALWASCSLVGGVAVAAYYDGAADWTWYAGWYLETFAWINLALFALNLVPVQPLDGGRLLHLAFLRVLSPGNASRIAGAIGLVLSIAWLPALAYALVTWGGIPLLFPSIPLHWRMMKGEALV